MTVTMRDVAHDILDVVTAHHLLHYVKNGETRTMRFVTGAAAAGIGFIYGPRLHEFITRHVSSERTTPLANPALAIATTPATTATPATIVPVPPAPQLRGDLTKLLGYAAAGGGLGYTIGPSIGPAIERAIPDLSSMRPLLTAAARAEQTTEHDILSSALTVGSIGWLGWSLLYRRKDTLDRQRQLWGIGGATLGYLFGPELIARCGTLAFPDHVRNDIVAMYRRGGAIAGAALGAGAALLEVRHGRDT